MVESVSLTITFIYGVLAAICMGILAVGLWRWLLARMDEWVGFKNEIYTGLTTDKKALAIYLAARLIAVAIIVAAVVGRFI